MRVMFVSVPLQGHLLPLLPFAAACRDAGHDVVLAGGGFPVDVLGLRTVEVAARFDLPRSALLTTVRHPRLALAELRGVAGHALVGEIFGRANLALVEPLTAVARQERPDVIVYEPLSEAGAVVAGRLSIPSVLQENTLWPADQLFRSVTTSRAFAGWDVPVPALTISVMPPSLRERAIPGAVTMRPVPSSGGGELPGWLAGPGDRPRILVSRSTLTGPAPGDPSAAVVAAAASVDAEFVLVRARIKGRLPANVRPVGRIPISEALPHAAGFVHHAGAGSILGGLAAGVPQLVTPGPGDRTHNAGALAATGAGLSVAATSITADTLTRLLTDTTILAAARTVAAEIAAMPAPAEVVPLLEAVSSAA
ncbi:MAG TPA: nucleotide disphospho-sugar-binding domain-containing protein [Actinoplanes sp.]|nr:nucleotide disphospho-sugar-binding domain-containing protein [Actinoplanes sp.]